LLAGFLIEILGYGGGFLCVGLLLLITAVYFGITMMGVKKPVVFS
jgi:hypothetical protein